MELELTINDWKWKILLTDIRKTERFSSNSYSATGLGLAGYLSDLWTDRKNRTETSDMTVQQLANYEVFGTDWSLDWQADNWLVPANTYGYQDKTIIDSIANISQSAGAFILPSRELLTLTVKPKYSIAPWLFNAMTPDLVMAPDSILSREYSFRKQQDWNSVWVSGTTDLAVQAFVKITGTAGDRNPNSPFTHSLITSPVACRAKGIRLIGDSLSRHEHTFVLPLTTDVPLIEEGILLQVDDDTPWRGLVVGTSISANLSEREVKVRQTINIEQYKIG